MTTIRANSNDVTIIRLEHFVYWESVHRMKQKVAKFQFTLWCVVEK